MVIQEVSFSRVFVLQKRKRETPSTAFRPPRLPLSFFIPDPPLCPSTSTESLPFAKSSSLYPSAIMEKATPSLPNLKMLRGPRANENVHYVKMQDLHGAVPASRATALHGTGDAAAKVLDQVGQVAERVAVGHGVPASGAVALVVEPAAEDEVRSDAQEDAGRR